MAHSVYQSSAGLLAGMIMRAILCLHVYVPGTLPINKMNISIGPTEPEAW